MHGDSTVCASIDLREHPAVRRLTMDHLNEAIIQQAAAVAHQQANTPPPAMSKAQTPLASPAGGGGGHATGNQPQHNNNSGEPVPRPRRVILAPFGMSGTLTGQVYRLGSLDTATQKALDDWCAFYPLLVTADHPEDLPVMVEVVTGGVKLRYPTKYVLVSDIDEFEAAGDEDEEAPVEEEKAAAAAARLASIRGVPFKVVEEPRRSASISSSGATQPLLRRNNNEPKDQQVPKSGFAEALGNDLGHPLSMHLRPTVATVLPERVWQDCILNPLDVGVAAVPQATAVASKETTSGDKSSTTSLPMVSPSQIKQEPGCEAVAPATTTTTMAVATSGQSATAAASLFKFIDPSQKSTCSCVK